MSRNEAAGLRAVAVVVGGRLDDRTHAYDGNSEGRTLCGLFPDHLTTPSSYKIVRFGRCQRCDDLATAAVDEEGE